MSEIEVPEGWSIFTLKEVSKFVSGTGFPHEYQTLVTTGTSFIKVSDMNTPDNEKFIVKSNYYVNDNIIKKIKATKYPKNTIIFPKIGGAILTNKKRILSEDSCFDNNIMGLIPNDGVDIAFLYNFMLSLDLKQYVKNGPVPSINTKNLADVLIYLPPLEIQKKIVQKLDYVLGQLEGKKKEMSKLQNTIKLNQLKESIKFTFLLSLRLGKLGISDWNKYDIKKLGTLTEITSGGTPDRNNGEYWNGDIPWIKSGELLDGDIIEIGENITKKGLDNSSAKIFPPDTILVALYGQGKTRGKTGRLVFPATTNQACCAILPNPSVIFARYLQYWIRGLYWELRAKGFGGAQPNWNSTTIKNIEIIIPPIKEQKLIVSKLERKFEEVNSLDLMINQINDRNKRILKQINNFNSSILDKAFSGKLVK